ncbi:hypothetical protein CVV26_00970 [Candidatus Kuenenbacteria bacterium HGW-Kuenenbacteria-1]|uniref:Cell division protein FtsL n=1 Tax=Candidatus Kuenenbacteria bacterium HGW-Kuenenbacteria-1 TaxID=2013812 RepID=A0A2N1UNY0_9BACT|nr:MAG: hypothetical protein CVV26_00970 [Candidatus Kuenenbacteria bacterium HGW-Kuenenbacteria-1]
MSVLKPTKQKTIKSTSKITRKIILVSIIFMGFFYLIQTNSLAISGLKITDFKKQIEELKKDNKQLEIEFLQLQAVSKIEQASEELKMVKTNNAKYLKETGEIAVAK